MIICLLASTSVTGALVLSGVVKPWWKRSRRPALTIFACDQAGCGTVGCLQVTRQNIELSSSCLDGRNNLELQFPCLSLWLGKHRGYEERIRSLEVSVLVMWQLKLLDYALMHMVCWTEGLRSESSKHGNAKFCVLLNVVWWAPEEWT